MRKILFFELMFVVLTLIIPSGAALSEDVMKLSSVIKLNEEQPAFVYIIPWQDGKLEFLESDIHSLLADDATKRVTREEFLRSIKYSDDLINRSAERRSKSLP